MIVVAWVLIGLVARMLVVFGAVSQLEIPEQEDALSTRIIKEHLAAASNYIDRDIIREDGHVRLYAIYGNETGIENPDATNSEAMSYNLLLHALDEDKRGFDATLDYIEETMLHELGYMMWRVEENGSVINDGENVASDADLRMIKALLIAEERWGEQRYTALIDRVANGLEQVAITNDTYLASYGGAGWVGDEVWLSYADYTVFSELAERRGGPWPIVYEHMKQATIDGQVINGLFNPQLTVERKYAIGIDGGGHSINAMWIMVRCAESDDPELREAAQRALTFYAERYEIDAQLFALYNPNGDPLSSYDTAWTYALVGRAAAELGDDEFASTMTEKLLEFQEMDRMSRVYGAIPEGKDESLRVGQFTMQESMLTLHAFLNMKRNFWFGG